MPSISVKMPKELHARLVAEAARKRTTKSALLRAAYARKSEPKSGGSLWDKIGHLAGSIDGPGNLSALSKTLPGYGRSRRP